MQWVSNHLRFSTVSNFIRRIQLVTTLFQVQLLYCYLIYLAPLMNKLVRYNATK